MWSNIQEQTPSSYESPAFRSPYLAPFVAIPIFVLVLKFVICTINKREKEIKGRKRTDKGQEELEILVSKAVRVGIIDENTAHRLKLLRNESKTKAKFILRAMIDVMSREISSQAKERIISELRKELYKETK